MLTGRWRCFIIISPLSKCQSVCVCGHSPLPLSPLSPLVPISVSLHYPSSTLPPHPESWVIKHEMRLQTNSVCVRAVFSYPSQCCISLYFPFLPSCLSLSLSLIFHLDFPFGSSLSLSPSHHIPYPSVGRYEQTFIIDELSGVGFTFNLPIATIHGWTHHTHSVRVCVCVFGIQHHRILLKLWFCSTSFLQLYNMTLSP